MSRAPVQKKIIVTEKRNVKTKHIPKTPLELKKKKKKKKKEAILLI